MIRAFSIGLLGLGVSAFVFAQESQPARPGVADLEGIISKSLMALRIFLSNFFSKLAIVDLKNNKIKKVDWIIVNFFKM